MIEDQGLNKTLEQKIGQMIMVGFDGTKSDDEEVQLIHHYISNNTLGNVILYGYNIENPTQLKNLTAYLQSANNHLTIATDQEGGKVQRLSAAKGFTSYKSAKEIASNNDIANARLIYSELSRELKDHGINLNFAPIVDLDSDESEIIGALQRSFSKDPSVVAGYAGICIDKHRKNQVLTCVKHFPGHGLVTADSHKTLPDATEVANKSELEPYYQLMAQNKVDMIMTAHIMNKNLDDKYPATLSSVILKRLLRDVGYDGVIISDDLFMSAIVQNYSFKDSVIMSINAGCDMLIFSNNKAACEMVESAQRNISINLEIIEIVKNAIISGEINIETIDKSYARIMKLKKAYELSSVC
ncbi:Beta-hexosaminidase [Candidatus Arcanobacter lacustris]|uniref:Beta-hexosaminidase n=1 Tax=Candidatus Arcanibacter lacustris TaxID=1607817 RepID=A0A0F5MPL9_9RICK|nr:Beta-hexosaminidase [Candidatus Arcanobacter lacustris]